jgi:hypothetical protein
VCCCTSSCTTGSHLLSTASEGSFLKFVQGSDLSRGADAVTSGIGDDSNKTFDRSDECFVNFAVLGGRSRQFLRAVYFLDLLQPPSCHTPEQIFKLFRRLWILRRGPAQPKASSRVRNLPRAPSSCQTPELTFHIKGAFFGTKCAWTVANPLMFPWQFCPWQTFAKTDSCHAAWQVRFVICKDA